MRIPNFNSINPITWTAWKKTYIDDLNIKITSLWNHLVYQNPPYTILNSVTSNNQVNLTAEGYCIKVESNNGPVNIFFPTHLQLHQGFYNDSNYGDALLGYWDGDIIRPINFGTFTPFQSSVGKTNVESYDFLSGYCCVANVLPAGNNTPDSQAKLNPKNYLIYPLGNGSFFTFHSYQENAIAKYRRNDMGGFVNQTIINLCSSLRYYCHKSEHKKLDAQGSQSILSYNPQEKEYYIADIDNNLWTGDEDIVPEIYDNNNELIICDLQHQVIEETKQSKTLLYRLLVNTNITSNNAHIEVY